MAFVKRVTEWLVCVIICYFISRNQKEKKKANKNKYLYYTYTSIIKSSNFYNDQAKKKNQKRHLI